MRKKSEHIPVYTLPPGAAQGIMMMRESFNGLPNPEEVQRPHRDGGYTFIIQEKGTTHIEIDFQTHCIEAPSAIYIHPNQVHRIITFDRAKVCTWMITEENLRPEYLVLLDNLAPVSTLSLTEDTLSIISEMVSMSLKLFGRKEEKLYNDILKDSCNALVAIVTSRYLAQSKPADNYTRFEVLTKRFKQTLEHSFKIVKSPAAYAGGLNITTSYLNECVKATTGQSITYHIQQRVILEAKRLLYHSSKSVKEIAAELGYDDYSYFTRLFVKVTRMTPVAFRDKNRE